MAQTTVQTNPNMIAGEMVWRGAGIPTTPGRADNQRGSDDQGGMGCVRWLARVATAGPLLRCSVAESGRTGRYLSKLPLAGTLRSALR